MWIALIIAAVVAILAMVAEHWVPFQFGVELEPWQAYTVGSGTCLLIWSVWAACYGPCAWEAIAGIWAVFAAAGLTVIIAYRVDRYRAELDRLRFEAEQAAEKASLQRDRAEYLENGRG
ncbi:MAG: hypothetical protein JXA37_11405 [Chloroflexia bacterium]|nr:hypothetical protein [Chloroflexia bacterium]